MCILGGSDTGVVAPLTYLQVPPTGSVVTHMHARNSYTAKTCDLLQGIFITEVLKIPSILTKKNKLQNILQCYTMHIISFSTSYTGWSIIIFSVLKHQHYSLWPVELNKKSF